MGVRQVLVDSRPAAFGRGPTCRDTGAVGLPVAVGVGARIATGRTPQELADEGLRRACSDPDDPPRAPVVRDPLGGRRRHFARWSTPTRWRAALTLPRKTPPRRARSRLKRPAIKGRVTALP